MPSEPEVVTRLYRRAGFGASAAQLAAATSRDLEELVEDLVNTIPTADQPPPVLADPGADDWDRWSGCVMAWLDRMATTPTPLADKLALFWHGHFVSSVDKVGDMAMMWQQVERYRTLGAGNLRTLAQAMAVEPAMLRYLDNADNVAGQPNRNFGRELLELFLLGGGQYTESDVEAASRAWTGHGLDERGRHILRPEQHDGRFKTLFGRTAPYDGPDVINAVFDHPGKRRVTARHIVARLWSFFTHTEPPATVVRHLADVLIGNGFELRPTLRALFLRPEFHQGEPAPALPRSPIDWCVALMRVARLPAAETHPEWALPAMGQAPFAPPGVDGWRAEQTWASTAAAQARAEHAAYVAWKAGPLLSHLREVPVADAVAHAFTTFGVTRPSGASLDAITAWLASQRRASSDVQRQDQGLFTLVALSPELQVV